MPRPPTVCRLLRPRRLIEPRRELTEPRFATAPLPLEYVYRRYAGGTEQAPPPLAARLRERSARRWPELFALQFVLTLTPAGLAP